MWPDSTWVVVPCPGSRKDELDTLVYTLEIPVNRLVVVTNDPDPLLPSDLPRSGRGTAFLIKDPQPGKIISRWWNLGIDLATMYARGEGQTYFEIFMPGSDISGESWSVAALAVQLRRDRLSMVGPDLGGRLTTGEVEYYEEGDPRDVHQRVPGACMMIAGEQSFRLDERFRWWYSDDDLEMQARHSFGAALVGGTGLLHSHDHALDATQTQHAVEDRARFTEKWGREPW